MRGFALYVVAGILAVLAIDFMVPPIGLGLAVIARPTTERGSPLQFVDRSGKGNRLRLPGTSVDKQQTPRSLPTVMVGCDPVFSPLSASARANFAGRCVA
jgi:hypothetical protein